MYGAQHTDTVAKLIGGNRSKCYDSVQYTNARFKFCRTTSLHGDVEHYFDQKRSLLFTSDVEAEFDDIHDKIKHLKQVLLLWYCLGGAWSRRRQFDEFSSMIISFKGRSKPRCQQGKDVVVESGKIPAVSCQLCERRDLQIEIRDIERLSKSIKVFFTLQIRRIFLYTSR